MKWRMARRSGNVVDRRGRGRGLIGGGLGTLVLVAVVMLLGGDPTEILQQGQEPPGEAGAPAADDTMALFVDHVLGDTEDTWGPIFRERFQAEYEPPRLVLFTGAVQSACGMAQTAVGPFYCPMDRQVYIDLSFFRDLRERFGAPGDFAQAYVIAHEVGHHVQTLLGISQEIESRRRSESQETSNALSVRQELQADCFAGVWAFYAHRDRQLLEPGDAEEALGAAAAIGDDRLQQQGQGYVQPETFTHGSSAQRMEWFNRGMQRGDVDACDTF